MGSKANTGFTVLLLLASILQGFIGFRFSAADGGRRWG
jgi:hypothetical protein